MKLVQQEGGARPGDQNNSLILRILESRPRLMNLSKLVETAESCLNNKLFKIIHNWLIMIIYNTSWRSDSWSNENRNRLIRCFLILVNNIDCLLAFNNLINSFLQVKSTNKLTKTNDISPIIIVLYNDFSIDKRMNFEWGVYK